MEHIRTLETRDLAGSVTTGGCGECQPPRRPAPNTSGGGATQRWGTGGERGKGV